MVKTLADGQRVRVQIPSSVILRRNADAKALSRDEYGSKKNSMR